MLPGGLGPVSRFPRGLLDLFGVKQMGENPRNLAEFIQPTYDIAELTLHNNTELHRSTAFINIGGGGGTAGGGQYSLIPSLSAGNQECLIVTDWCVRANWQGTGALIPFVTMASFLPGAVQYSFWSPLRYEVYPGLNAVLRWQVNSGVNPIIVPAGHECVAFTCDTTTGVAAGTVQFDAYIRYIRVQL